MGRAVTRLPVGESGRVGSGEVRHAKGSDIVLVSLMLAQADEANAVGARANTDAAQAVDKIVAGMVGQATVGVSHI